MGYHHGMSEGPVYAPSVPTMHQQFVNFGPNRDYDDYRPDNRKGNKQHRRESQEPMMDNSELQHQRLEEFVALQQQMAMLQHMNSEAMAAAYFAQMQNPYMSHGYGGYHGHHMPEMPSALGGDDHMMMPLFSGPEPTHNTSSTDPCPCIHCAAASQLTPARGPHDRESTGSAYPTPEEFTPSSERPSARNQFETPPRRTKEWRNERSSERRPVDRSDRAERPERRSAPNKSSTKDSTSRSLAMNTPVRNLASNNGQPQFQTTIAGHHGRKFQARSHHPLVPGDYVIFEGDRGDELGCVKSIETLDKEEKSDRNSRDRNRSIVLRLASNEEIAKWKGPLMEEAADAVAQANEGIKSLGLPLVIRAASFQFDHKKLTFFYESDDRVDFRRFLAEMYNKFRCRIWMERTSELETIPSL